MVASMHKTGHCAEIIAMVNSPLWTKITSAGKLSNGTSKSHVINQSEGGGRLYQDGHDRFIPN